jgi:tetratricopeptide (TPR) repeat protein
MKSRKLLLLLPLVVLVASCNRDPRAQAARYLENGNKFFQKARYKEASIMYRRALQKDLRFGEAYYRLGLTDIKLAAYGDAARALRRAIELQPNNTDAAVQLANLYMAAIVQDPAHSKDLVREVQDISERLVREDSNSYEGHRLKGQLALVQQKPDEAVKELAAATRLRPGQTDLSLAYFEALEGTNRPADAEKLGREVIEKNKNFAPMYDMLYVHYMSQNKLSEAEQVMLEKVENNPKQPNFLVQLAGHYLYTKERNKLDATMARVANGKEFPEGHLLAGDFYFFRAREYEAARQQYEAGMTEHPKEKPVYQKRMVELLAATGRNSDANQLLASILKDNPKDNDALAMRAALMLQTGDAAQINQATNDLVSLVTKNPDNHLLRYNLARAYIAKNDLAQARLQLEAAIKVRPDFILAHDQLARIYLAKGENAKALKETEDVLNMNKADLQARLIRSSALTAIGDKDKARQELDTILRMAPDNPDARYQAGFLAWQDRDFKRAEQIFGDLYKANPKDIRGLVGVVETMVSENKMRDAVSLVEKSAAAEPDRRDFRLALADLYVRDNRFDDAIHLYQDLLKNDPKSADLLLRLAETQRRKGDINTAIETYRRAAQAIPSDPRPLLQLGLLMDGTGRREQAKPIYEQVLRIQPDDPVALNNLAFIKAEEGSDLDEALTMAQRARQKLPDSPDVLDTLGWIYIKKNLADDAVRTFKELVQKQPDRASFRYHYGMALLQKGDRPGAKRELQSAIALNPSKDEAGKIRQLLASM